MKRLTMPLPKALLTGAAFLALILAAGSAWAGAPLRAPNPPPAGTIFAFSDVCNFPVQIEILVNQEYTLTFPLY